MAWSLSTVRFLSGLSLRQLWTGVQSGVSALSPYLEIVAFFVTVFGAGRWAVKYKRRWPTRHLRKVWGLKDGEHVIVICSELEDAEKQQTVGEPREFIYHRKYGDLDAYFEVIITLRTLFPRIKLSVFSSGEAEDTRIDMAEHIVVIGGPDYNAMTEAYLAKGITHYAYRSPDWEQSVINPNEIVLYCGDNDTEYCEQTEEKDYGYFERIRNPDNPTKNVILIGGCHTLGVTAAVKAYSVAPNDQGEIRTTVLKNAKKTANRISRRSQFAVLVAAERKSQTISVPIVKKSKIVVRDVSLARWLWQRLVRRDRKCFLIRS